MSLDVSTVTAVKLDVTGRSNEPTPCKATLHWNDRSTFTGVVLVEGTQISITGDGVFKSGSEIIEGRFVSGKLEGYARWLLPNGSLFEGVFVNGRREGKGKLTQKEDNTVIHGIWREGELDGQVLRIFNNGSLERASWTKNKRDPWSMRKAFAPGYQPLIVFLHSGAYNMYGFYEPLARFLNIQCFSPFHEAYSQLLSVKDPTAVQKRLLSMLEKGKDYPRRPLVGLTKRFLERSGGSGLLVNFPESMEEAEELKGWGYEVSAFVMVHLTPEFLTYKFWRIKNPNSRASERPRGKPKNELKDQVSAYYAKATPLTEFYSDVYMPIRDSIDVVKVANTLRRKFYVE